MPGYLSSPDGEKRAAHCSQTETAGQNRGHRFARSAVWHQEAEV
jgi:hypothetical protein